MAVIPLSLMDQIYMPTGRLDNEEIHLANTVVEEGQVLLLTNEIMNIYLDNFRTVLSFLRFNIRTFNECITVVHALEKVLMRNKEYFLSEVTKLPKNKQAIVMNIRNRFDHPEQYVLDATHTEDYLRQIQLSIRYEVSQLGIFARQLKKKEEEILRKKIEEIKRYTTAQLEISLFVCCIERLSRGRTPSTDIVMSPVIQKLGEEGIDSGALDLLSEDELNCLVFNGDSGEALAIADNLATKVREQQTAKMR